MQKLVTKTTAPILAWMLALPALAQADPTGIRSEKIIDFSVYDLVYTLETLANWLLAIIGIVAVIMILYGAFLYIVAAGDEDKVKKAKNVIIYGLVGVVVAILAFAIVSFVASLLD